ncbi:PilT protein domain protein [Nitrosomonas sp. Is79A3]|uniref:PIN domain-containing protein n=1 Tax=Nitrosomonas sp. (strain Is79A3) TaxID=261292 RepID=UPI000215D235
MNARLFADANVWIYAHLQRANDPRCQRAAEMVKVLPLIISNQVINEYYSVMLKNKASDAFIQVNIKNMLWHCDVFCLYLETLAAAFEIRERYRFSWWDSLIVASALETECEQLYTEDLQHGQIIEDRLRIVNPFLETTQT